MTNTYTLPAACDWLLDLNESKGKSAANNNSSPTGALKKGSRNVSLTSFAGSLVRTQNLTVSELTQALLSYNETAHDPLDAPEVIGIANSVFGYSTNLPPAFQDIPLSRHIAAAIQNRCRYVPEQEWMAWQGAKWIPDIGGNLARECIKKELEAIYDGVRSQGDPESTNKARALLAGGKVAAMLALIQSDECVRTSVAEFDAEEDIINVKNGTLDLTTLDLDAHQPDDMLSKLANAPYDPAAECPHFDALLESILPDEHQDFVLRLFGYTLLGNPVDQVFAVFTGKGANGKSTLLNAVAHALGDYATNVEPSSLIRQKGERVRNDLARLKGIRLVGTSELAVGEVLDAPLIKRLTGGDMITARALYKEYFEFAAQFVVFMTTNALPVIDGGDTALARRLVIVPFRTVVPEDKRDHDLPRKLREEAPGILKRLVEGMVEYGKIGLSVPNDLKQEAAKFCASSDMLGNFLAEKCEFGPEYSIGSASLYSAYKWWNSLNGLRPLSTPQFKQELTKKLGHSTKKTKAAAVWPGMRLLSTLSL